MRVDCDYEGIWYVTTGGVEIRASDEEEARIMAWFAETEFMNNFLSERYTEAREFHEARVRHDRRVAWANMVIEGRGKGAMDDGSYSSKQIETANKILEEMG